LPQAESAAIRNTSNSAIIRRLIIHRRYVILLTALTS